MGMTKQGEVQLSPRALTTGGSIIVQLTSSLFCSNGFRYFVYVELETV